MTCPPPPMLARFERGLLKGPQREIVANHVARCPTCTARMAKAPEASPPAPPEDEEPISLADMLEPWPGTDATRSLEPGKTAADPSEAATRALDPVQEVVEPVAGSFEAAEERSGRSDRSQRTGTSDRSLRTGVTDEPWTPFSSSDRTGASVLPRGAAIGRYLVVEPLGSGGLGDVYTAYDPKLDRCVAIKVLRPKGEGPGGHGSEQERSEGRDRLLREAKALARLAHPNVVAVHDVGSFGDDVFVAMERVEGMTLSQWYRAELRTWQEVRDVFLGAGAGLQAAHEAKIVHRDFKPQNVIVSPDGRPRVLDFGLARAVRTEQSGAHIILARKDGFEPGEFRDSLDDALTIDGAVMGTPQYMAPEQFEGSESTGPKSDQFSFCVAMWVALYRERPFQAEDIPKLIVAVRKGELTEPKDRRKVPAWLHKVLLQGLSRQPDDRFESMTTLLAALEHDKRSRRRQWLALGSVALVSAVGAAAAAIALQPPITQAQRDAVGDLADEARDAAARSFYVYPDPMDEDRVTAYRKVLALEAIEGPADDLADHEASALRDELADTMSRLGDRYYDREGGRAFASDYYAAALIFDPSHAHARSRTTLTPGELAELRAKAAEGDFSAAELTAAASLAVLAIDDDAERQQRLLALIDSPTPAPSTTTRLAALLGMDIGSIGYDSSLDTTGMEPPVVFPIDTDTDGDTDTDTDTDGDADTGTDTDGELPPLEDTDTDLVYDTDGDATGGDTDGGDRPSPSMRNPAKSKELARKGMAALNKGQFTEAEALFHRALGYNRRNATALGGLAELFFERGSYQKAVQYGAKAVRAAPRRARYRIVLGDAYFKTLAYQKARREYAKAEALGHPSAPGRLAQLRKLLGQ